MASAAIEATFLERGLEAYERGEFERAMSLLERARTELPSDLDVAFHLARAWVRNERVLEAEDLVGDLLLADSGSFRARVLAEPAFESQGFTQLLSNGGVSSLPDDEVPRASFDLDGDGENETFAISHRTTNPERFLAIVAKTPTGVVGRRLTTVTVSAFHVSAFRTSGNGAVVLLQSAQGHSAAAEIHLVHGKPLNSVLTYSKLFVQDAGDGEGPPPTDGALWFSVIDIVVGGEPEVVLTFIDPMGEPNQTWVLDINGGGAKELGVAQELRRDAAQRLRAANPSVTRPVAEALVRLEPDNPTARLSLLTAPVVPTKSEWWGFYPPGSSNYVALHSAFYARHSSPAAQAQLAKVPGVAAFLTKWALTPSDLASHSEPLVPPTSLWGHAYFLEMVEASTAFSYFRFAEGVPGSPGD